MLAVVSQEYKRKNTYDSSIALRQSNPKQLELVSGAKSVQTVAIATIVPVPDRLALDTDRFYISCGDWYAAIQLSRAQAYRAIELCGRSRERDVIWGAIEQVINGGVK